MLLRECAFQKPTDENAVFTSLDPQVRAAARAQLLQDPAPWQASLLTPWSDHRGSAVLHGRAVGLRRARPPRASKSRPAARSSSLFTPLTAPLVVLSGPLHARRGDLALGLGAQAAPMTSTCTGTPPPGAPNDLSAHPGRPSRRSRSDPSWVCRCSCAPFVGAREHTLRRGAPPRRPLCGRRRRQPLPATQEVRGRRDGSNAAPDEPSPCAAATHSRHPPRVAVPPRASRRRPTARPRHRTSSASAPTPSAPPSSSPRRAPPPAVRAADASLHYTSLHFTTLHFTPRAQPRRRARLAPPAAAAPRQARAARALCPLTRSVAAPYTFLASSSRLLS